MNVSLDDRWVELLDALVRDGRYASRDDAIVEAMRLLERKEENFRKLKAKIEASIAEGGSYTWDEVMGHIEDELAKLDLPAHAAE